MKATHAHFTVLVATILVSCCFGQEFATRQKSPTTENLRGVSALSNGVAWASGTHGTYLRTLDGGKTWRAAQVPGAETLDFRDVEAFSADVAYLLSAGPGDESRIYNTADGGKNWTLQFTNPDSKGFFDCMAFWNSDQGIALGDPVNGKFELIVTEDGGKNWKPLPRDKIPPAVEGEGAFAASGSCITVEGKNQAWFVTGGKAARVFHSIDRGETWQVTETPIASGRTRGNDSSGIFSVAFRDANYGVIVGGDYKNPRDGNANVAFTDDGGANWKVSRISPQSYFSAVAFTSRHDNGVLAVGSIRVAYTEDFRKERWAKYMELNLNAVSFFPTGDALAVGPNGTIVHFATMR